MKKKNQLPPELTRLEDCVGEFMTYWGFKKVHGRIWTHLFTSKAPLDTEELMERLSLSKGMMSIAMRELVHHQVILEDHIGRHGVTFYKANPDLFGVITRVLRERETVMLAETESACQTLLKNNDSEFDKHGISREHCQEVLQFTQSASRLLDFFLFQGQSENPSMFDTLGCQSPLSGSSASKNSSKKK